MIKFTIVLLLITQVYAEKTVHYQKPYKGKTFLVKENEHLVILTEKPVVMDVEELIIKGKLEIKENLLETKIIKLKNKELKRIVKRGENGQSIKKFSGGSPYFINGGGGASSLKNGIDADYLGYSYNINKLDEDITLKGGKGGKGGLSGGILYLTNKVNKFLVTGDLDVRGNKGEKGQPYIGKKFTIKKKCNERECCLDSNTRGKGECLEVGVCYEQCPEDIFFEIGKGGDGADGADGYIMLPKSLNYESDLNNIIKY